MYFLNGKCFCCIFNCKLQQITFRRCGNRIIIVITVVCCCCCCNCWRTFFYDRCTCTRIYINFCHVCPRLFSTICHSHTIRFLAYEVECNIYVGKIYLRIMCTKNFRWKEQYSLNANGLQTHARITVMRCLLYIRVEVLLIFRNYYVKSYLSASTSTHLLSPVNKSTL